MRSGCASRSTSRTRTRSSRPSGSRRPTLPCGSGTGSRTWSVGPRTSPFLFGSPATGLTDVYGDSLLGASPSSLRRWGYQVTSVPNVDDRIAACLPLTFGAQLRCWADLDEYLMTQVVPWVPLVGFTSGRVVSARLAMFSFDQAWGYPLPALDQIATGPSPAPSPA